MEPYRIIVAGSRTIYDYAFVRRTLLRHLRTFHNNGRVVEIVTGRARAGPDDMVYHFARWDQRLPYKEFKAKWDALGKGAGFARNAEMAEYADELILFWDGVSNGSKHMLTVMTGKSKPVTQYLLDPEAQSGDYEVFDFTKIAV